MSNPLSRDKVKISVIIRTHNSKDFIDKALSSVFSQTLPRRLYEIVVVDDGSTDRTKDILRGYGSKIKLIEDVALGSVKAANLGIKKSKGEYAILLDSDDTLEPTALEEMLNAIEHVDADFVICDYYENSVETNEKKVISLKDNIFNSVACGILFKKSLLDEVGGYDENFIFTEYDLLIKLIKKDSRYIHIPRPLFIYVRHKGSLTSDKKIVKEGFNQLFSKYGNIEGLRDY